MRYTVKHLAEAAGVSSRTLHFYDEIGLLKPDAYGENGYRYYGETALLRLQQILFFKELDFSLTDIRAVLDRPGFDILQALHAHRQSLQEQAGRLSRLIETVDRTIAHMKGARPMAAREFYQGFCPEKQKGYEEEIRQRYGDRGVKQSYERFGSYSPERKQAVQDDFHRIVTGLRERIGLASTHSEVLALAGQLHTWMGNFFDCSLEAFEGIGHGYNSHPDFISFYETNYGPGVAAFLEEAITAYCAQKRAA